MIIQIGSVILAIILGIAGAFMIVALCEGAREVFLAIKTWRWFK